MKPSLIIAGGLAALLTIIGSFALFYDWSDGVNRDSCCCCVEQVHYCPNCGAKMVDDDQTM